MRLRRAKSGGETVPARRRQTDAAAERPSAAELAQRYTFRRNRTITGSSSREIVSSAELTADLRSPRAHAHHLTTLRRRLALYFIGVGAAAGLLYLLVSQLVASATLQVTPLTSLPAADRAAYQAAVESYYGARPIERLRFLLKPDALLSHIQATRPEVASLRLEPGANLGEAVLTLTPRHAVARWDINGASRYVDKEGVVFVRNYGRTPKLRIIDDSGLKASATQNVASNRFLSFVGRVVADAADKGLTVRTITIPEFTTRQIAIKLRGSPISYKFSIDRSAGEQVEDMARVRSYLQRHHLRPSYVDLRVKGKAFYK
jgi:hypothetical protein